jgi:hypothetical protein
MEYPYGHYPDAYPENAYDKLKKMWSWLPRQDQLQDMLPKEYVTVDAMFNDLNNWIFKNDDYLEDTFYGNETAEQLWLAFVMKEKWNKSWNGKEWINLHS